MDRGIRGAVTGTTRHNSRCRFMILLSLRYNDNSRRMVALKDKDMLRTYSDPMSVLKHSACRCRC